MKRFLVAAAAALTMFAAPAMAQSHGYQTRGDYGRGYSVERHDGGYNQSYRGYGYDQRADYRFNGYDRYPHVRSDRYQRDDRGYRDAPRQHRGSSYDRRW